MMRTILFLPILLVTRSYAVDINLLNSLFNQRHLEIGDFEAVNAVLSSLSFPIPNQTITQDVAGSTLTLDLTSLVCSGLNIGDILVSYQETETLNVALNLIQADLVCTANYNYAYLFFNGGGVGTLMTQDNVINLNMTLTKNTDSLIEEPPLVDILGCDAAINIADIQLDGDGVGIVSEIIEALEFSIKGLVADQIKGFLCQELVGLDALLQTALDNLHRILALNITFPTDPLEAEAALSTEVDWLDFKNPTSWMEQAVSLFFDEAEELLADNIDALWSGLLASDGSLSIDTTTLGINDQAISSVLGNFTFGLRSSRIFGLESINITELSIIGSSTLSTNISVGTLRGELECWFELKNGESTYTETAIISIEIDDIAVQLAVLAAIDESELGTVALGSILAGNWGCLVQTVKELSFTKLDVAMNIQTPTISGIQSPGLARLAQDAANQMFLTYGSVLNIALPKWIENAVLELDLSLPTSEAGNCTNVTVKNAADEFVDFRDLLLPSDVAVDYGGSGTEPYGSLIAPLKSYITDTLANGSALSSLLDMIITPLSESTGGALKRVSSDVLAWDTPLINFAGGVEIGGLNADIALKIDKLVVENLDSLSDPLILEPIRGEASRLNNSISLAVSKPLRLSARVLLDLLVSDDPNDRITNDMVVSVEMNSVQVIVPILAKMLTSRFMNFPIQDLLAWQCWLATMPAPILDAYGARVPDSPLSLSIMDVDFSAVSMNFTVDCLNCTSPKFVELSTLLNDPESDILATQSAENVISFLLTFLSGESSIAQAAIDKILVDAPRHCPHLPEYNPNATATSYEALPATSTNNASTTFLLTLLVAMVAVIATFIVAVLILKVIVARRNRKWLATLPAEQVQAICENQKAQRLNEQMVDKASDSLILSKELSLFVRCFIPVVILGNIALFLSGHLSLGGEVRIYLQIGGQEFVVSDFYTFSIAQSGVELWNAGAKAIALLMLLFSGVWPYTKQLMTLILWVLPPRFVGTSRRESALLWLDTLGKWSMIDVFVMIITVAAFHVAIKSPEKAFLPSDFYQIDLLVAPLWGLYANMLAQLVSQIASHYIIHYHRVVSNAAKLHVESKQRPMARNVKSETSIERGFEFDEEESKDTSTSASDARAHPDEKHALCNHAFARPHRGESAPLRVRSWVNPLFIGLSAATIALLLVGCILPSYSFDYLGLVGLAVESGMDFQAATIYLSVISTAQLLMDQARFLGTTKDLIGLLSIAIVLVMTCLVVPVAQVVTLVAEWLFPMRRVTSSRLRVAMEIFLAWQYVEVFLLSVIVAVWQIGDVSTFMVNDYCGGLSDFFSFIVNNGVVDASDGQCFRAQAAIEPASYVLIAAACLLVFLTKFVSMATAHRARDENNTSQLVIEATGSSPITTTTTTSIGLVETEDSDVDSSASTISNVTIVPVLFSDQYRWLLVGPTK